MITVQDMERLMFTGGDVVGADGRRIGAVGQLFLDATTGDPAWVTVRTGLFGTSESFVPLAGAQVRGDEIVVPYEKDQVKHAPRIDSAEGHLPPDGERDLYRHYGLHDEHDENDEHGVDQGAAPEPATAVAEDDERAAVPREDVRTGDPDAPAGAHRPEGDAMVLSAEQARVVGTQRVPTERVRLRRYTVTEQREITVPVQREEVRVEYEPAPGDPGDPQPQPGLEPGTARAADVDPGPHRHTGRHVADPGSR